MHSQRRRLVIHGFQRRLMSLNLAYLLLLLTLTAAAFFIPLFLPSAEGADLVRGLLRRYAMIWPALVALGGFFVFHSIYVSHRVAGALYRFSRVFERVASGDLTARARIRQNDYLQEEAGELNSMIANLHVRVRDIAGSHEALGAGLAALTEALESGQDQRVEKAVDRLRGELSRLEARLELFHMEPRKMVIDENTLHHLPPIRASRADDPQVVVSD